MQPEDYRPDPPAGIGYADFRAARARYLGRAAAQSEIALLERAWALARIVDAAEPGPGSDIAGTTDTHRHGGGGAP
jgi:hypothetical protein